MIPILNKGELLYLPTEVQLFQGDIKGVTKIKKTMTPANVLLLTDVFAGETVCKVLHNGQTWYANINQVYKTREKGENNDR